MTPLALDITLAAVCGLCLGSFLNVVAYRLPSGLSLASPPSSCPGCGVAIRPYDNVPVASWLALGGHCRDCGDSISVRYPLTEAVTAVLFTAVTLFDHGRPVVWLHLIFVATLVAITRIDIEHRIIPNRLVGVLAAAALLLTVALEPHQLAARLIAGAGAGGVLLLAALAYPGGMGMGDVKLAAAMGLVLGAAVIPALFIAILTGTVAGVAVMARLGVQDGRRTAIPFGPFLALGSIAAVFAGPGIVHLYLHGTGL